MFCLNVMISETDEEAIGNVVEKIIAEIGDETEQSGLFLLFHSKKSQ